MLMQCYPDDGEPVALDTDEGMEWSIGRIGHGNDISFGSRRVSRTQALVRATLIREQHIWELKHVGENPTWQLSYVNGELRAMQLPHNQWVRLAEETIYQIEGFSFTFTSRVDDTLNGDESATLSSSEQRPHAMDPLLSATDPSQVEGWYDVAAISLRVGSECLQAVWRGPIEKPSTAFRLIWCGFLVVVGAAGAVYLLPRLVALLPWVSSSS